MGYLANALLGLSVIIAEPLPAQDNSIQLAIDRGKTMYEYDRAAWLTSDDLIARLPQDRQAEVGGWIVTPTPNGLHTDYFGKGAAADHVIYAADVRGNTVSNSVVYPANSEASLKAPALQMARALRAAWAEMNRHADWQPCARARFNTIVLPPEPSGTVSVYFLTPQTETGKFPFGGHYEVDIAADGRTVSSRAFTHGCLTMAKQPGEEGGKPVAVFVTHLMDPHPTEIHVFEQYYAGIPVLVGTGPKSVWQIESGTIKDVSAMLAK